MPLKRKLKRRTPSDAEALRGATDPGIVRNVLIAAGLLVALGAGLALLLHGVR
jgi:hypothetical protein